MPRDTAKLSMPWVESPVFTSSIATRTDLTAQERDLLKSFHESGYVIVENAISPDLTERVRKEIGPRYAPGIIQGPRSGYRYQDAWRESPAVRDLALDRSIRRTLQLLYGREPFPFQTLNFRVGSQQANHSDAILFNSLPARYMCGVWVALEDVDSENGPLFYHPGSHKLPEFYIQDFAGALADPNRFFGTQYSTFIRELMRQQGLPRKELHIPKGSFLVWASNLVHGGMPIADENRTRASQVTHYFFADCAYYSPLYSDPRAGELCLLDVSDFQSGQPIAHTLDGAPARTVSLHNGRHRLQLASEPPPDEPPEPPPSPDSGHGLLGPFRRLRRPQEPAPSLVFHIDAVEESDEAIAISGWAYDPTVMAVPGHRLKIVLSSKSEQRAFDCYITHRREVAGINRLADPYCGFHVSLARTALPKGSYRIDLAWTDVDGTSRSIESGRCVDI